MYLPAPWAGLGAAGGGGGGPGSELRATGTSRHFHEKLAPSMVLGGYNWRLTLQRTGETAGAAAGGAPAQAPTAADGRELATRTRHAGQWWDLIVTLDDATSEV